MLDDAWKEELTSKRSRARVLTCCHCRHFGAAALSGGRCTLCSHPTCGGCELTEYISPRIVKAHHHQHKMGRQSDNSGGMDLESTRDNFFAARSIVEAELSALRTLPKGTEPSSTAPHQLRNWLHTESSEVDHRGHGTTPTLSPVRETS